METIDETATGERTFGVLEVFPADVRQQQPKAPLIDLQRICARAVSR